METLFLTLLNRSYAAGWLILAVMGLRLLLRRMPKRFVCLLWALVAVRLVMPLSAQSGLSLIPSAEPLPEQFLYAARPEIESGMEVVDDAVNPILEAVLSPREAGNSVNPVQVWAFVLARVWLAGAAAMLVYALAGYLGLKRRVAEAIPVRQNIRRCEFIDSPFVLGLVMPVIYLPASMEKKEWNHVLRHEQAHVERRDPWWKFLGFVLLSIYWFHPLCWAAYILLCRDIEGACDEKVIGHMDREARREYASALLNACAGTPGNAAGPLAFGEVGIRSRIKAVMDYRKPARWAAVASGAVVLLAAVAFLTDPLPVYDPDAVYPQAVLRDPEYIEVAVTNGTDRIYEKGSAEYTALMEQLRKNWWKYTQEGLDTAADDALVRPAAPEVLKTKSWRTYVEISDTIICLCYPTDPVVWENADGSQLFVETIAFVLPEKTWSEENTRGFFAIAKTEQFGINEGIYTYYYPAALANDFWGFILDAGRE